MNRVLIVLFLAITAITFLFFGFLFAAAYSDYGFRGCPGAQQCDGAVGTMYTAGAFMLGATLLFIGFWRCRSKHKSPK